VLVTWLTALEEVKLAMILTGLEDLAEKDQGMYRSCYRTIDELSYHASSILSVSALSILTSLVCSELEPERAFATLPALFPVVSRCHHHIVLSSSLSPEPAGRQFERKRTASIRFD
jgi:hypothetical protein